MNYIVAVACIALIVSEIPLISTTPELTADQLANKNNVIKVCASENNVDEATLSKIKKLEVNPTEREKCFVLCALNKWNMYQEFEINEDKILELYGRTEAVIEAMKKCSKEIIEERGECEIAYNMFMCFESSSNHVTPECARKYGISEKTLFLLDELEDIDAAESLPQVEVQCFLLCGLNSLNIYKDYKINEETMLKLFDDSAVVKYAVADCSKEIKIYM